MAYRQLDYEEVAGMVGFEPTISSSRARRLTAWPHPINPNHYKRIIKDVKTFPKEYLRSVIFGVEDSLVSTTGLIAGISIGSDNRRVVLLGGLVAIMVEAVSMGAGEYLSDDAVAELDKLKRQPDNPLISGLLMFCSYLLAGLIPLLPVVFFAYPGSVWLSVILALGGLFMLGFLKGKVLCSSPLRGGFKILAVGGVATLFGIFVGSLFELG